MTKLSTSQTLGLSTVLLAAIAFRMVGITSGWLWFDELLSVNFSNNGLIETVITVARFDVHPPAYYMQLALWMMFGASDTYLRLNAVVWGILAVLCVYLIGWRLNGPKSAFAAAGLLAASPAAVFYSEQVRMYTFVMFFVLLSFWFLLRFLATGKSLTLAGMLASMIVVIYSHGVGLIMTSGVSAYAFASVVRERRNDLLRKLVIGHVLVAIASVPVLVFMMNHGVTHTLNPSLRNVLNTARFLLFGTENDVAVVPPLAMFAVITILSIICLWRPKSRLLFAATVVFPMLVVFAVSRMISPIWLDRTVLFTLPFFWLSLVTATDFDSPTVRRHAYELAKTFAAIATAIVLVVLTLQQQTRHQPGDDYKPMALFVAQSSQPGDLVVMPTVALNVWCFLWYFAGPHWGRPLDFHEVNEKWQRLLDKIGPTWTARLGLNPTLRSVNVGGVIVTNSFTDIGQGRVFVISISESKDPPARGFKYVSNRKFQEFVIQMWTR